MSKDFEWYHWVIRNIQSDEWNELVALGYAEKDSTTLKRKYGKAVTIFRLTPEGEQFMEHKKLLERL